jgi:hypothetical protein
MSFAAWLCVASFHAAARPGQEEAGRSVGGGAPNDPIGIVFYRGRPNAALEASMYAARTNTGYRGLSHGSSVPIGSSGIADSAMNMHAMHLDMLAVARPRAGRGCQGGSRQRYGDDDQRQKPDT